MPIDTIYRQLVIPGKDIYHRITNAEGKFWLLPARHLRTGWCIYQPSNSWGRWLKRMYPLLQTIPGSRHWLPSVETLALTLAPEWVERIKRIYGCDDFEWSLFGGTPGARRKMTLQISHGRQLLGYIKLSDQTEVKAQFEQESQVLHFLQASGVDGLPGVLALTAVSPTVTLFAQDTRKTLQSSSSMHWTPLHQSFCTTLYRATKKELPFSQTDYAMHLRYLEANIPAFSRQDGERLKSAIEQVRTYWEAKTVFSAFHGDFTPWNIYIEQGKLYPFDWEYAASTFPPFLDAVHFVMQATIVGRNWKADEAYKQYRALRITTRWKEIETDAEDLFLLTYLVYILSFYTRLYQGVWPENDRCYLVWMTLTHQLTQRL